MDGSICNGNRQPDLHSFELDKSPEFKYFSELETIHYEKLNKSVLKNKTIYSADDGRCVGENLTFTLLLIKTKNIYEQGKI